MKTSKMAIQFAAPLCAMLLAAPSLSAAGPEAKTEPSKAAAATKIVPPEEGLSKKIAHFSFSGVDFRDVVLFLREYMGTNVVVRWRALEQVGIPPDVKMTIDLRDVTVETALKTMLRDVNLPDANLTLTYAIKDGVLVISTPQDLNKRTTVVYDVSEIVEGAEESDIIGLTNSLVPLGVVLGDVQLVKGSLIVSADASQHEKIREMIDQVKKNASSSPPSARAMAKQSQEQIKTIVSMKDTCSDPMAMCVVALGCLRSETKETPEQLVKMLEGVLAETSAVGARSAIRMTLKDLYGQMGNTAKVKEHLLGIIKDNEKAIAAGLGGGGGVAR